MKDFMLEACVDSAESACIATENGAMRLELCANLVIGGTTPTLALFQEVRKRCSNTINVLIRPRFGDFCYSDYEFEIIKKEISQFEKAGADGVVIGILKPDGSLDCDRMRECMGLAEKMQVTLHRAIDVCKDPYEALEQSVGLGIDTILTSGQEDHCLKGAECIKRLHQQAGGRITIMAGSGVKAENLEELHRLTGIKSFHMSGKKLVESRMQYRKENVHMGTEFLSEFEIWQTDAEAIGRAKEILAGL